MPPPAPGTRATTKLTARSAAPRFSPHGSSATPGLSPPIPSRLRLGPPGRTRILGIPAAGPRRRRCAAAWRCSPPSRARTQGRPARQRPSTTPEGHHGSRGLFHCYTVAACRTPTTTSSGCFTRAPCREQTATAARPTSSPPCSRVPVQPPPVSSPGSPPGRRAISACRCAALARGARPRARRARPVPAAQVRRGPPLPSAGSDPAPPPAAVPAETKPPKRAEITITVSAPTEARPASGAQAWSGERRSSGGRRPPCRPRRSPSHGGEQVATRFCAPVPISAPAWRPRDARPGRVPSRRRGAPRALTALLHLSPPPRSAQTQPYFAWRPPFGGLDPRHVLGLARRRRGWPGRGRTGVDIERGTGAGSVGAGRCD